MLPSFTDYCLLLAELPAQHNLIQSSTLTAYTIGPWVAEVTGELIFIEGYVLTVWELLVLHGRSSWVVNWSNKALALLGQS